MPAVRDPDFVLVRRARRGDQGAFTQLVRNHQDRVYSVALGVMRNPHDAADIVQETFIAALQHLDSFNEQAQFSTWIHRVAIRKAYDELRRRTSRPQVADGDDAAIHAAQQHGADGHEQHLQQSALLQSIAELDDGFREAVLLIDVLGCSLEETAEALDVAVGTVKSRVFRGRAQLGNLLGTFGVEGASKQ